MQAYQLDKSRCYECVGPVSGVERATLRHWRARWRKWIERHYRAFRRPNSTVASHWRKTSTANQRIRCDRILNWAIWISLSDSVCACVPPPSIVFHLFSKECRSRWFTCIHISKIRQVGSQVRLNKRFCRIRSSSTYRRLEHFPAPNGRTIEEKSEAKLTRKVPLKDWQIEEYKNWKKLWTILTLTSLWTILT